MTSEAFLRALRRELPDLEARPSQKEMLRACESALKNNKILLVEAPTGVGKTFAYAIPAVLAGRKTIISTNKKNLQEQLVQKDLPLLAKIRPFRFALAKGFSNYLCLLSLRGLEPITANDLQEKSRLVTWAQATESGEVEELSPPSTLWREVAADSAGCLRHECPFYDECFYFRARDRWFDADILVANHALLAADAALYLQTGRGLLPEAEVLIIDEAHALEEAFSGAFTRWVSAYTLEALLREARLLERRLGLRLAPTLSRLETLAPALFEELRSLYRRERQRVAPSEFALRTEVELIIQVLQQLQGEIERFLSKPPPSLLGPSEQKLQLLQVRKFLSWLDEIALTLISFIEPAQEGSPRVRWTEALERSTGLNVAPLYPKTELQDGLLARFDSVISTSATLSIAGDFSYMQEQLGITGETLALDSSFDYANQVRLFLHRVEPPERGVLSSSYLEDLARRVREIVTASGGGALVLFTNARVLDEVHRRLQNALRFLLLRQGEEPRPQLLARFQRDGNAVLLGLDSFWEGIDVPGAALRTVIITKLPFEVPDDPIHQARVERLREAGRDAFSEYMLPRAALKLKQGFGRLIRSATDVGDVHILDGRVLTRAYGKRLLQVLPQGIETKIVP
jgi:ATP-dependent DNA helicase DinG